MIGTFIRTLFLWCAISWTIVPCIGLGLARKGYNKEICYSVLVMGSSWIIVNLVKTAYVGQTYSTAFLCLGLAPSLILILNK